MKQATVNSLPRHLSPLEDGSKWDDQKWVFPVTTAGARSNTFSIDWNIPIGDKTLLDPEFAPLLDGWRFVLWVFTSCPPDGNPRKGSYCSKLRTALRMLLPWMVDNNLSDLSGLDKNGFSLFIVALQNRLFPDNTAVERRAIEGATDVSISVYISMFRLPYIARAELRNAGIPYPHSDPLQGQDALSIAKSLSKLKTVPTKEIDDNVYITSVNTAFATITAHWVEDLISLNNAISQRLGDDADYLITEFFRKYAHLSSHKNPSTAAFRSLVVNLRIACQITIFSTTGIRVSELCGLTCSLDRADSTAPSGVRVEPCLDDNFEIFLLCGRVFKDTPTSEDVEWVLGMRPVGSSYLSPPVIALDILERLDRGWRELAGIDRLLIQFNSSGLPHGPSGVVVAFSCTVRAHGAKWVRENVDKHTIVTPHMWRKTFARYLIRVSAELLPAISRHMKHMAVSLTERGYCQGHASSREIIRDARVQEAVSLTFELINGNRKVVGPAGTELLAFANAFAGRLSNKSRREASDDVKHAIIARKQTLYGMDFGYCVFQERTARCHNLSSTDVPLFARLAPAFRHQRVETCSSCKNYAVADEHLEYWRNRRSALMAKKARFTGREHVSLSMKTISDIEKCDVILSWWEDGV